MKVCPVGVRHTVHWPALDACGLNVRGIVVTLSNDIQDEPFLRPWFHLYWFVFPRLRCAVVCTHMFSFPRPLFFFVFYLVQACMHSVLRSSWEERKDTTWEVPVTLYAWLAREALVRLATVSMLA